MRIVLAIPALLAGLMLAAPAGADTVYFAAGHGGKSHVVRPWPHHYSAHSGFRHGRHGHRHGHFSLGSVYSYVAPPPVVYYQVPVRPAYVVVPPPVVTYRAAPGYCREYTAPIAIGGREVMGYGQACMRPDGSWELGPLRPEQ